MITMSVWFFWFAIFLTALATAFVAYWLGVAKSEKAAFTAQWDTREEQMNRLISLNAENRALKRTIDEMTDELVRGGYSKNVWRSSSR